MAVSSIDSTMAQQPNLFEPVGNKELDRNDFMTLFITQLQYQDPLKPMDSYEMASQLAQFSNMEATMKMSENMEKLLDYQTSQNNLQLLSLLDKRVQTHGNRIGVNEGAPGATEFVLRERTDDCVVEIYNEAGHLVRSMAMGPLPADTYELEWDGKDKVGEQVADGVYSYVVKARDLTGQEVEVDYRSSGLVTGLTFDSGKARLTIDKRIDMAVSDVVKVM